MAPKEIKEFIEGVKVVLMTVKKISADGKIGLEDLPHVMGFVTESQKVVDALKGLDLALIEAKSLSEDEAKAIVGELYAAAKAVQEAA